MELSLGDIERKGKAKVSVYGGYTFGDLGGEYGPFVLRYHRRRWEVASWEPDLFARLSIPSQYMEQVATRCHHTGYLRARYTTGYTSLT
ncbi:MAG: hypothetical protein EOP84_03595 [Verrucomicrobiaceae bacterium]|nr:MAG: hypothetical protein EOP84_03595 [Verrucomicrobiaceae bacterium]